MYSRSYIDESERVPIPEKYDGFAFGNDALCEKNCTRPPTNDENSQISAEDENADQSVSASPKSVFSPILGLGKGLFGGLFGSTIKLPKLGTEEILIIATALFLLFSKEGDKECAILLLLLLLIN